MLGVLTSIVIGIMVLGVILGLVIFGLGTIGVIFLYSVKVGICLIPLALAVVLVRLLFGI